MKTIKLILEIIGWCQIAFGTTLFSALIAAALYYSFTKDTMAVAAVVIIVAGFVVGSIWATRI